MEKRALLAFVLSLLVLFGYQYLFLSDTQRPVDREPEVRHETPGAEPVEIPSEERAEKMAPSDPQGFQPVPGGPEKFVVVETDLATYRISTKDAAIKQILLKNYKDELGEMVRLIPREDRYFPLHMIFNGRAYHLDFSPSRESLILGPGQEQGTVEMSYRHSDGSEIVKIFEFHRTGYEIGVTVQQNMANEYDLLVGSHAQKSGEKEKSRYYGHAGPVLDVQGEIERIKYKKIEARQTFGGRIPWLAFEEKYFMTALLPEAADETAIVDRLGNGGESVIVFGLAGGKESILSCRFYAGPKDYEILKSYGVGLEQVINFGVFGVLAKPMFYILKAFYRLLGSYGLAIILLTTLIKIIFWPLTHKQQNSMKAMQKVQPEMTAIREKFKQDPQRMNREVMALYKKHKVNPASGCLPLVIQIPVFFALYNVLLNAIELRGAPFLYIPDLSAADTLFGHVAGFAVGPLPLLMGVSMYVQQKMMPTVMDPKQAKIFQLMPVIFTFMFLNFPSGLVLYWLVNNLLTILQQYYINKKNEGAAV